MRAISHPACSVSLLFAGLAPAQTLLHDFNQTPSTTPGDAFPSSFVPMPNGDLLFVMSSNATGSELWRTDGSAAGTTLVADVQPGSVDSQILQFTELSPGVHLFSARTIAHGWELWRTDGTSSGTFLVADVWPGPENSTCVGLTRIGNRIAFFANDGAHGIEPWITDGTPGGTHLLVDVVPGPFGMSNGTASMASIGGGNVVFTALIGQQWQLWRSDGTAAGTSSIRPFNDPAYSGPSYMTTLGNKVLFKARDANPNEELWVTDGTLAGTLSLGAQGYFYGLQIVNGLAFFQGFDAATGVELWRTDGTVAGTNRVTDLMPGSGFFGNSSPWLVGELQGDLIFMAHAPGGPGLYRSNGTAVGTSMIAPIGNLGAFYGSNWGKSVNGEVWFSIVSGPSPTGLYRTDGTTAGTSLVTSLETGDIGVANGTIVMRADDGTIVGDELYVTDGTPAGTQLLLDVVPPAVSLSSYPVPIGNFRDQVVVRGTEAATGEELWLTDGTPQGTTILADLAPGSPSFALQGFAANDRRMMFFGSNGVADGDPWFSDGTAAGTAQLDILPANSGFMGSAIAPFGDRFVFNGLLPATGGEPWISDGTAAGTMMLRDVAPGSAGSGPDGWFALGDHMLFTAYSSGTYTVWSTDGTPAGTMQLHPLIGAGNYLGFFPVEFGGHAYYAAEQPGLGIELFRSDGTAAGTGLALDLAPGPASSRPGAMAAAGARLIIAATIGGQPRLVSTDGTPAGTTVLSVTASAFDGPYVLDEGHALFVTFYRFGGAGTLYRTDGTDAGTVPFLALPSVGVGMFHEKLGVDRLLFNRNDPATGTELWTTDGTAAGTLPVFDLSPTSSHPSHLHRAGNQVVFMADDHVHGFELFAVDLAQTGDWARQTYGEACPPIGGNAPQIALGGVARGSAIAPFSIDLSAGEPNSLALLAWSGRRGAIALPGGCTLWIDAPIGLSTVATDASGAANVAIPPSPAIVGARLDAQYLVLDPQGPVLGLFATTRALEFVVGP